MSEKLIRIPMLPEEAQRAFVGGKKYAEEALAELVFFGGIPANDFRVIEGVDDNGNPIYRKNEEGPLIPLSFDHGPKGAKHRQPVKRRH